MYFTVVPGSTEAKLPEGLSLQDVWWMSQKKGGMEQKQKSSLQREEKQLAIMLASR